MLTYDYTPGVVDLYRNVRKRLLTISYTAAKKEKGCEMIAFCDGIIIPDGKYSSVTIE